MATEVVSPHPKNNSLVVPVYLNQRFVFDLIAMKQDGISTIQKITSSETTQVGNRDQYEGKFGLGQALSSLLKIDISGSRAKELKVGSDQQTMEERVHTPASLFQKLRSMLQSDGDLRQFNGDEKVNSGDLIEFEASLQRNPLIQIMDSFVSLYGLYRSFEDDAAKSKQKHGLVKKDSSARLHEQMKAFAESLRAGGTVDIISSPMRKDYKAVITLEEQFLSDRSMADLVDGRFSVIGKIIRVINDSTESISLLRKGALGAVNNEFMDQMFSSLSSLPMLRVPKPEYVVRGPVVHVLPICIFA